MSRPGARLGGGVDFPGRAQFSEGPSSRAPLVSRCLSWRQGGCRSLVLSSIVTCAGIALGDSPVASESLSCCVSWGHREAVGPVARNPGRLDIDTESKRGRGECIALRPHPIPDGGGRDVIQDYWLGSGNTDGHFLSGSESPFGDRRSARLDDRISFCRSLTASLPMRWPEECRVGEGRPWRQPAVGRATRCRRTAIVRQHFLRSLKGNQNDTQRSIGVMS